MMSQFIRGDQMKNSWWKRPKCATCSKKFNKKDKQHVIQLEAADGTIELKVCDNCANFWDASAEVLQKGRKNEDDA